MPLTQLDTTPAAQRRVGVLFTAIGISILLRTYFQWRKERQAAVLKGRLEISAPESSSSSSSSAASSSSSVPLSHRATELIHNNDLQVQMIQHFKRLASPLEFPPYSATQPDGYIALAIAENKQIFDLHQPYLTKRNDFTLSDSTYNDFNGQKHVRRTFASFFSRFIAGRTINPDRICMTAGCNMALDSLFFCLADPDDFVLLAQPYYAAFKYDLNTKSGVKIQGVLPDGKGEDQFKCSVAAYKSTYAAAVKEGKRVRAVLLCNPHNPCGTNLTREELIELVDWVKSVPDLHLVSDEIYALSSFGHCISSDNQLIDDASASSSPFISLSNILPTSQAMGDRMHITYAISKDFGLSGFRCGMLYTENMDIHKAYEQISPFNGLSTLVQHFVYSMMNDEHHLLKFISTMQQRLAKCVVMVCEELKQQGIPYLKPTSGLFIWIDMSAGLSEATADGELKLYHEILEECNVNLVPGMNFYSPIPGWFRLVHSADQSEAIRAAIQRLGQFLKQKKEQAL